MTTPTTPRPHDMCLCHDAHPLHHGLIPNAHGALLAALRALVEAIDGEMIVEMAPAGWWDNVEQARALLREVSPK